jgi:D-arabinose 1-dehydrogenase-like Zn-dependent alcohol dehydrogenase
VPTALRAVAPGGTVVCGGIHMSDIPAFPYDILWKERAIRSVANLTRRDAEEFLALAPQVPVRVETVPYPLEQANAALTALRDGTLTGAAVLVPPARAMADKADSADKAVSTAGADPAVNAGNQGNEGNEGKEAAA